jgi:hypothetical protein
MSEAKSVGLEENLLEEVLVSARANALELRARNATKLFNQAAAAIADRTIPVSWEVLCEEVGKRKEKREKNI